MSILPKDVLIFQRVRDLFIVSLSLISMNLMAGEASSVVIGPNGVTVAASVYDASLIELRVAGPDGFHAVQRSESGAVDWYPGNLSDGEYRYEVFVTVGDQPAEGKDDNTELFRENGLFKVESGVLAPVINEDPSEQSEEQVSVQKDAWYVRLAEGILELIIPSVQAADLTITDASPVLFYDDTTTAGVDWWIGGFDSHFGIYNSDLPNFSIYIDDNSGADVLRADSNGNIEFADGAVFINKLSNYLGIGTITPTDDIHVVSSTPAVYLDDTVGGDLRISNSGGEVGFTILNGAHNGDIMHFENDLVSNLYPGVGIWEIDPEVPLHVGSHDGQSAGLMVENTSVPPAGDVSMFRLVNPGTNILRFVLSAGGNLWTFDNDPNLNSASGVYSGQFRVAKVGTGLVEFSVDGFGNGRFRSNSYALTHVNTSSRALKTGFQPVDHQQVLEQLAEIPIMRWEYRSQEGTPHVGPVAEDFKVAFGLGDGEHIATVDADGIALAAIQGLHQIVGEQKREVEEQKKEIEALKQVNETLRNESEAQLALLAARLEALETAAGGDLRPPSSD